MQQASSFGAAATEYDRIRPGYPPEAVRWLVGDAPVRVVDLGAGTGIFSRQLAAAGHEVVPVEPDEGMRRRLAEAAPGLTPLAGSAEAIPLPDASADAVTAAQAYHWFDAERTHREVARVLRPGGVFGPVWNVRDEEVAWLRELSRALDGVVGGQRRHEAWRGGPASYGPQFEPTERAVFRHATRHTVESLVALARSRSYWLTADAAGRAEIEAAVRGVAAGHPDLAGRESFELPYVTVAYRARRR